MSELKDTASISNHACYVTEHFRFTWSLDFKRHIVSGTAVLQMKAVVGATEKPPLVSQSGANFAFWCKLNEIKDYKFGESALFQIFNIGLTVILL